jgi:hypothetical protein
MRSRRIARYAGGGTLEVAPRERERQMTDDPAQGKITAEQFTRLLATVAHGWEANDPDMAADCFTEDAIYIEPPSRQVYVGREALREFFAGGDTPALSTSMTWHHIIFDQAAQLGSGEYTYHGNNRYHGVVVARVRDGQISHWREYQRRSPLDWLDFIAPQDK